MNGLNSVITSWEQCWGKRAERRQKQETTVQKKVTERSNDTDKFGQENKNVNVKVTENKTVEKYFFFFFRKLNFVCQDLPTV